ncbi:MAG TPA: gluconate 2-dehydrogenase subunit 3 family protein [Bryobacteraceae bacterium]|jgi:hypothetical protein|nr:gluconate 2-dehydrogenase subunit 3 family protein [Bryobacteraceae bacterium]
MNRRDALKAGAVAVALPGLAPAAPQSAPAASWTPSLLSEHQNATVIVLTDLIIPTTDTPGAKDANVNRYIDLFLKDGGEGDRARFLNGLEWLDTYTTAQHGKKFIELPKATQIKVLEVLDKGESPAVQEGHEFFRLVKSMTVRVYYNTEAGFRELNKGGRVPGTFGCGHSGNHA